MRRGRAHGVLVLLITFVVARADAHVAPSVDDNNRYLKLTPAADRVRLAYTVFFGDVPGAQTRRAIDANHDGQITDAESQAFGHELAAEVAAGLELTIDGAPHPVIWTTIAVGMGSPITAAGTFSVDLVSWACLPTARGRHTLLVRDRFRIPRPGETEVKVEDGLGITVDHTRVGRASDPSNDYRFLGPRGPLAEDGLELGFTASDQAPLTSDGTCTGTGTGTGTPRPRPRSLIVAAAAVVAFVLAGSVAILRRRRARR